MKHALVVLAFVAFYFGAMIQWPCIWVSPVSVIGCVTLMAFISYHITHAPEKQDDD
jgi:hypothetical protein